MGTPRPHPPHPRRRTVLGAGLAAGLGAAGLAGCGAGGSRETLVVAIVSNPQMQDAISLVGHFTEAHPEIDVRFVSLPENEARAKITASVASGGGEFDVVMISNYETPLWAANGWLTDLEPYIAETPGYQRDDFLPTIRDALSVDGAMHSVPFYGESSFLVYRRDLFEQAGLTMPERPTWDEIRGFAETLHDPAAGLTGIALRGLAGWGENLAPMNTVINTFGGQWFDEDWTPRLDSDAVREAVSMYVDTVRTWGQPGAATSGFGDCLTQVAQGTAAMWYDASSMVSGIEDPRSSTVMGDTAYALAPTMETEYSGWLYSWALAIPETSPRKQAAWDFIAWMTHPDYFQLVGSEVSWEALPPGSRRSTYEIPEYAEIAENYAEPTLTSMDHATQEETMAQPVPYPGLQFVGIPEFQDLGTRVGQQFSAAIAGQQSVDDALAQAQRFAESVARTYGWEG
ncbi:ABC transporter substrate-binding protein [Brachybacterium saurashtrense]|uniref:Sugar ABC transporter substrate-binding protein n=1 Tax=Brachybacterium saurashtrense TaxID=556288 RepID=A0A345YQN0_9MICO|nr:sugar ABC transporter substrate-binding protein [Brachybacterium saurashtrense]AXK46232.1 sugar ABC transporter substrate-binding protein [Brachybacterium saurashtrense]RRR23972.1 sugar ABC transporter substrate-binding protein [Brachybacterium saurashtrense]